MQVEVDPVLAEVRVAVSTARVFMTPCLLQVDVYLSQTLGSTLHLFQVHIL